MVKLESAALAFLWLTSCIQDVRDDVAGAMRTGMKGF